MCMAVDIIVVANSRVVVLASASGFMGAAIFSAHTRKTVARSPPSVREVSRTLHVRRTSEQYPRRIVDNDRDVLPPRAFAGNVDGSFNAKIHFTTRLIYSIFIDPREQ